MLAMLCSSLRTLCFFISMWQIRESGKSEILDQKFFSEIKLPRSLYFVTESNYWIFFNTSDYSEFLGRRVFNQDIRRIASLNVVGLWTTEAPGSCMLGLLNSECLKIMYSLLSVSTAPPYLWIKPTVDHAVL